MSAELLQCYNKGCGQKFKEEENGDGKLCMWIFVESTLEKRNAHIFMIWREGTPICSRSP